MSQTVIPLKRPIVTHGGPIKEVVLREPSFDEYLSLGDPFTIVETEDGNSYAVHDDEKVRQYIKTCLVQPTNYDLLTQGGLSLARRLKRAVFDFFRLDGEDSASSQTSPTTSSSVASPVSTRSEDSASPA